MSVIFEWWRDVPRYEHVRAAEDAAAVPAIQHRDLPDEVALLRASVTDILGRVVRLEAEMDAGQDEQAAPAVCDPAFPGEGIRTERVTLEFQIEGSPPTEWPWSYILSRSDAIKMRPGESVRVVDDDDLAKVTAERDAARAEAERLRDRVAELEAAAKTAALLAEVRESEWRVASELAAEANAENAGGEAKQEPVAWGVLSAGEITQVSLLQWRDSSVSWSQRSGGTVVPLYAAPPEPRVWMTAEERGRLSAFAEYADDHDRRDVACLLRSLLARSSSEPRGWLTAEEREAVDSAADAISDRVDAYKGRDGDERRIEVLDALLARSSPPRVKVPNLREQNTWRSRDDQWVAAIREAGGEVEDG